MTSSPRQATAAKVQEQDTAAEYATANNSTDARKTTGVATEDVVPRHDAAAELLRQAVANKTAEPKGRPRHKALPHKALPLIPSQMPARQKGYRQRHLCRDKALLLNYQDNRSPPKLPSRKVAIGTRHCHRRRCHQYHHRCQQSKRVTTENIRTKQDAAAVEKGATGCHQDNQNKAAAEDGAANTNTDDNKTHGVATEWNVAETSHCFRSTGTIGRHQVHWNRTLPQKTPPPITTQMPERQKRGYRQDVITKTRSCC